MNLKRFFKPRLKSFILQADHKVVEAFKLNGKTYYQFDDSFKIPSGRGMTALTIYEEFRMRTSREYLELHTRAMDKLLDDPHTIRISAIVRLNENLKERLNLALLPDMVYKLASVIFFDKEESPYTYDYVYNKKKIEDWKRAGGTLDFFLKSPLGTLIGYSNIPGISAEIFSQVSEEIDKYHLQQLREV